MKPDYEKLYRIAEPQGGYFTVCQAQEAGYSRKDISSLASNNKFTRVAHGLYRITFFPATKYEDLIIAVLKSGPKAVISHDSALSVYQLSDILPDRIHVTIPGSRSRRPKGIKFHTCKISGEEITSYHGLPITTVERTITDVIRNGLDEHLVKHAIEQSLIQGLITNDSLVNQAARYGRKTQNIIKKCFEDLQRDI